MKLNSIRYTKLYKSLVRIYRFLTRNYLPTAYMYNWLFCIFCRKFFLLSGELISIDDYTAKYGAFKQMIIPSSTTMVYENTFIDDELNHEQGKIFASPVVYVSELRDICVYGGYDVVSSEREIITPVYNQSTKERWSYTNQLVCIHAKDRVVLKHKRSDKRYDTAVFLCGCSGGNYYHFMVEILPKLALLEEQNLYPGVPIFVDESIGKISSMTEALRMINSTKREIVFVEEAVSVFVRRLVYVSALTTAPPNLRRGIYQSEEEYVVAYKAIECLKEQIMRQVRKGSDKRIYLARYKNNRQRLQNDKELADICREVGFRVVFPDKMSFVEQVSLFMGAEYIVSCAGAAIANTMFSSPGTKVYMIVPRAHDNHFWTTFMRNMGLQPILIDARIESKADYIPGDLYKAELQDIKWVIQDTEGEKNVY